MTATDLALYVTQMLRAPTAWWASLWSSSARAPPPLLPDRATVANMAPEYGATMGFFPFDEVSAAYLRTTGRSEEQVATCENYFRAQGLFGMPRHGELDYSVELELDLSPPSCPRWHSPKRPQDRIP